jgi:DNA-binding transcriptional MerR regulator
MSTDDVVSVTPKYLIGTVTKLTGLSIDVVRVWERRYGAVRPARSDGGTRLYSDADVLRLKRLRQAVDKGFGIGQVARFSEIELDEVIGETRQSEEATDPFGSLRKRFIDAIQIMDVVAAEQELARAATLFSTREVVKNIVAPTLKEAGERCSRGEFGAAHEHLASALLRNLVSSLLRLYPASANGEAIVLATPAQERHEFGLLLAALLAAIQGWRVVYLGADLPAPEIAQAVRLTNARVLMLSVSVANSLIDNELRALSNVLPISTRVWIGGEEATRHRAIIERANWVLVRNLEELDDMLKR